MLVFVSFAKCHLNTVWILNSLELCYRYKIKFIIKLVSLVRSTVEYKKTIMLELPHNLVKKLKYKKTIALVPILYLPVQEC